MACTAAVRRESQACGVPILGIRSRAAPLAVLRTVAGQEDRGAADVDRFADRRAR